MFNFVNFTEPVADPESQITRNDKLIVIGSYIINKCKKYRSFSIYNQQIMVSVLNFISTARTQTFGRPCCKKKENIESENVPKIPKKKKKE